MELVCHSMAWFLGDLIGTAVAVDIKDPQYPALNSMDAVRVKVTIDPTKPVPTGAFITSHNERARWIPCMPERVFCLCQQCGVIGHTANVCFKDRDQIMTTVHAQQQEIIDKLGVPIAIQPSFPMFLCPPMVTETKEFRSTTKMDFISEFPEIVFLVSDTKTLANPPNIVTADLPDDNDDNDNDGNDPHDHMDHDGPHYSP